MRFAKLSCLLIVLAAVPCFATTLDIVIDSSSLSPSTSGFIDFYFDGGYPATAVISNFSDAGGTLNSTSITTSGTVSGTLPGDVVMNENGSDYDEGITFGPLISFDLTLAGVPDGNNEDEFTLTFYNSGNSGGLLTGNNSDYWLVQVLIDTQGNVTSTEYANPSHGPSYADVYVVPEPASWLLCAAAFAGVFFFRRAR